MLRATAFALFSLTFVGCVADSGGEGFSIVSNEFLVQGGMGCEVMASATGPFLSHGQISTFSQSGYVFTPVMQSSITATTAEEMQQRTITLQGANIELTVGAMTIAHSDGTFTKATPPTLDGTDGKFQSQFAGTLPPGAIGGEIFEIVPVTTLAALRSKAMLGAGDTFDAEVTATIKPFGEMGGSRVDGKPFKYAVSVCDDCVVNLVGACPGTATNKGNPCNAYQDGPVDCCTDASNRLVCPAR
jgi:hypothetical protein